MQSVMENKKATRRNVSVFHQIVQWIPQGMIEQCARNEKIAARNLNYTPRTLPLMPGRDLRARRLLTLQPFYKSLASISHPGRVFIRSDSNFSSAGPSHVSRTRPPPRLRARTRESVRKHRVASGRVRDLWLSGRCAGQENHGAIHAVNPLAEGSTSDQHRTFRRLERAGCP